MNKDSKTKVDFSKQSIVLTAYYILANHIFVTHQECADFETVKRWSSIFLGAGCHEIDVKIVNKLPF